MRRVAEIAVPDEEVTGLGAEVGNVDHSRRVVGGEPEQRAFGEREQALAGLQDGERAEEAAGVDLGVGGVHRRAVACGAGAVHGVVTPVWRDGKAAAG